MPESDLDSKPTPDVAATLATVKRLMIAGGLAFWGAVAWFVRAGEFHLNAQRVGAKLIRRADSPVEFWGILGVAAVVGAFLVYAGLRLDPEGVQPRDASR